MKILPVITLLFAFYFSGYSQSTEQSKKPPLPKIIYKNAKSRHKQLKSKVLNKIIYPLLCECKVPIEDITVDFCPEILGDNEGERGCKDEDKGELTISVTVNRVDGASSVVFIERNKEGSFDKYEFLRIFSGDNRGCIPNKDCASENKQER